MLTLCSPSPDVTCFGCCPPIRPAHYDPIRYASSLRREFSDNRSRFLVERPSHHPIVGFSCWALGFLDPGGRRIGCLLHPQQNNGQDLRHLIDYEGKCQRESCLPAQMFLRLKRAAQEFWLEVASGLDSFYFSSATANPLFHILLWGPKILERLWITGKASKWSSTELLWKCRFLTDPQWSPRGHRFLFAIQKEPAGTDLESELEEWEDNCRRLWQEISRSASRQSGEHTGGTLLYVHQMPEEEDFKDFMRIGLGWRRTTLERAVRLHAYIRELVEMGRIK